MIALILVFLVNIPFVVLIGYGIYLTFNALRKYTKEK